MLDPETLKAPVRLCGVPKIPKAVENLKELNLGLRFATDFTHRVSALDNQFVYILHGIEAANILGEIVT